MCPLSTLQANAPRIGPGGSNKIAKLRGLEARYRGVVQPGCGHDAGRRQDHLPKGHLPVAYIRLRVLRGEADYGAQLP